VPDGTAIFLNRAFLEFNNIQNPNGSTGIGEYNIFKDPMLIEYRDVFQKAFRGETVYSPLKPPIKDLVDRGFVQDKPFESADIDVYFYPVWDGDKLAYVICVFIVKVVYRGQPDVAKAKEYIESHWQDEYDPEAVAKSVYMSKRQLYSLFKQHTGMAPGDYYNKCKIEHIKEKLMDKNLTITEVFAACGEDSQGWLRKKFKATTGMSPKEYRESL
jgi:AraC-like DNA-binding protein